MTCPFACALAICLMRQMAEDSRPDLADEDDLRLEVKVHESEVPEKAPVILRMSLRNTSPRTVHTYFKYGAAMRKRDLFELHATGASGTKYELSPLVVLTETAIRGAGNPLLPGQRLETEYVMCLAQRQNVNDRSTWAGGVFLPAGIYVMQASLNCPPVIRSNTFELTVTTATGVNAAALAQFSSLPLYAQGATPAPKPGARSAFGGEPGEVTASLMKIRKELADSVFAFWLEYWDLWFDLVDEDPARKLDAAKAAVSFADKNPDFPLTDNLLFRAVPRLLKSGELATARSTVARLRDRFPGTDLDPQEFDRLEHDVREVELKARK